MNFNSVELQIIYSAVKLFRDDFNADLSNDMSATEKNELLNTLKQINSVLRKLKKFMADNGLKPIT